MGMLNVVKQSIATAKRLQRAKDTGYDKDVYHSTNQDFNEVDIGKGDIGFHVGTKSQANNRSKALSKQVAGYPIENDAFFKRNDIPLHREGSNVMPLKLRTSKNVLEMPDIGAWHNSSIVSRSLAENRGGNIPQRIQDKAFDINEKIEDYMSTDDAYEHVMDDFKWSKSSKNRFHLDELNQMIRDEGYSTIKYQNAVENDLITKALPRQEIVDRIDNLSEKLTSVSDPSKRADIKANIDAARSEAMQSQYDDAFSYIALDPRDVRSKSAAFKDPSSKNIMSGFAATAVLAGTMTPEEAQAGALTSGLRRVIDERYSNPVGSSNPRKGVLGKSEEAPVGIEERSLDRGNDLKLEELQGHPYILTQSDRSAAGGVVRSVHDKEIDGVNLRGGRDFMFDPESQGQVWASFPQVVKGIHKRASDLSAEHGKPTLLLPYAMAPTGIDFSNMPVDVMINYARQGMSKSNIKKLDTQIRKIIPEWGGVANPSSNEILRNVTGDKRKGVADIVDKNFRDVRGGMSMGEARAATSASDQYLIPDGSLKNVGLIDSNKSVLADSGHPTYLGGLQGEGVGTLTDSINARAFMEANGRVLANNPSDIRSLSMNPSFGQGVIDDRLLDFIDKHKKTLAVVGGTTAATAKAESADRKNMTRRERRANPPSEVLRNYTVGQAGKAVGEMGLGVVQGLGEGLDFFNSANIQRSVMGLPQLTPAQDALSPITDIRLLEDGEGRDNARTIGSLFSPI